uniref:DEAD/DEAH box helicase n=1 Tax=uncultured Arthrobacter sp. TaxID=114050 RepID=UPI0025E1CEF5
ELLSRVLQSRDRGLVMVFCRTKRTAQKVADELVDRGFAAAAVHGDLGQGAREQALRAFRSGKIDVLVATEVAARGIDVQDVTHVINYQCPEDEKAYLHRVGRTGRAGKKGTAVTFVDWDDVPRWGLINKALGLDSPEPIETYSSSPHLFTDLDIPEGTKGRLPRSARKLAGIDAEVLEDLGETGKKGRTGGAPTGRGDGPRRDSARGDGQRSEGGRSRSRSRSGGRGSGSADEGSEAPATRRRRSPAAGEGAAEAAAPSATSAERPRRTRTRRRNGEVVAQPTRGSEE